LFSVARVDRADLELRRRTYAFFVERGRAPAPAELGDEEAVVAGWRRLHDDHAVVLNPATEELRMLNPFSAVPSAYRVQAAGRWWYGNCAWDAFGICAALHADGRIETSCPDCGEPIALEVRGRQPDDDSLLFHVLVPAAHWWDDIVFT
jgi:Alkylmercury lyase